MYFDLSWPGPNTGTALLRHLTIVMIMFYLVQIFRFSWLEDYKVLSTRAWGLGSLGSLEAFEGVNTFTFFNFAEATSATKGCRKWNF